MKAATINKFGDYEELRVEEIPTPEARPGHVLIKILAAGVNRLDHYIREGSIVPELPFPFILGADAAGTVAGIGEGVTGFEVGERVIPVPGFPQDEKDYDIRPAILAPSFALPGLRYPRRRQQAVHLDGQLCGERQGIHLPDGLPEPNALQDLGPGRSDRRRSGPYGAAHGSRVQGKARAGFQIPYRSLGLELSPAHQTPIHGRRNSNFA